MRHRTRGKVGAALLVLACGSQAVGARAADEAIALGGVYGYGDHTRIYGLQAAWAPQRENAALSSYDLGLRLTGQLARWVAAADDAQYRSLIDGSVIAELRYWLPTAASMRTFVEAGVGLHLVSNVHIADRNMTTAFNFGTQAAIGATFGDRNGYEIAALIHHVSNGGIKAPNNGLTYAGIRLRVELR